jgi:hypothetical protein
MTYVYFRGVDKTFDPATAIAAFRSAFADWEVVDDEQRATTSFLTLVKGEAWLRVATDVGSVVDPPSYSVVINSRDSRVLRELVP